MLSSGIPAFTFMPTQNRVSAYLPRVEEVSSPVLASPPDFASFANRLSNPPIVFEGGDVYRADTVPTPVGGRIAVLYPLLALSAYLIADKPIDALLNASKNNPNGSWYFGIRYGKPDGTYTTVAEANIPYANLSPVNPIPLPLVNASIPSGVVLEAITLINGQAVTGPSLTLYTMG